MDTKHAALLTGNHVLYGRALRFVLVEEIRSRDTMSVREMVIVLARLGYELPGRPSKVISDALRWERARGRVVRVRRGVYRYRSAPRTTARRIRLFATLANDWIVALRRGEEPPPVPADPRQASWMPPVQPDFPPWTSLNWLWST